MPSIKEAAAAFLDNRRVAVTGVSRKPTEQASLQLTRPITVLVGPNDSGKTSILRILDWLFNGDFG